MEYKRQYESLERLLERAEAPTDLPEYSRSSERGDREFCGTDSLAESFRLARYGWAEGRERMSAMQKRLTDLVRQRVNSRQEVLWDVAGAVVDVGRFCEGEPENMMYFEPSPTDGKGKIVKLALNVSASCDIEAEDIFWRGAAVIGLVDLLESNGFSVEIEVCEGIQAGRFGGGNKLAYIFPAKVPGYQLDIDRLAFVLANPSFLRRIMFAVEEREPAKIREEFGIQRGEGYGAPAEVSQEPSGEETGISVPSLKSWERTFSGEEGAVNWVLEQARAVLGVEAVAD
jgi:hypothetical protein